MAKCNFCAKETDFPYTCNYCGRHHCSEHRLPEKHSCPELYGATTLGPEFRKTGEEDAEHSPIVTARVEPGTVGTRKSPPTSKSPPVETKQGAGKANSISENSSVSTHLKRIAIIGIVVFAGIFLFTGYGPVEVGEFSNPSSSGVVANTTDTATVTPSQDTPTNTRSTVTSTELSPDRVERLVHVEINNRRQQHGLPVLNHDRSLLEIARKHSAVMAANQDIFHTQPDGDDLQDRYEQAGYDCRVSTGGNTYSTGGENVAKTWYKADVITDKGIARYDTPRELANGIVNQWMNSTRHRENILKTYWNNEGIGLNITQEGDKTAVYVTQDFC